MLWGLFGSSMMMVGTHIWEGDGGPVHLPQTTPFPFLSAVGKKAAGKGLKLLGHGIDGPLTRQTGELSVNMIVVVPSEPVRVSVQTNPSRLLSVAGTCGSTAAA